MITFLPAGMPVFSENGYKPIEEIKAGTLVLSAFSTWEKVEKIEKREYQGKLVGISCIGSTKKTFLTPTFQVPIFESVSAAGGLDKALSGKSVMTTTAETVRQNQFVLLPRVVLPEKSQLDVGEYFSQFRTLDNNLLRNWAGHTMSRFLRLNLEFGKLIGYMVAGKTVRDKNLCEVSFGKAEEPFAVEYFELLEKVFAVKPQIARKKREIIVRFTSSIVCQFLHRFFSGNYFPRVVWFSNEEFVRGVIIGLINARGTYNSTTIGFIHNSRRLLLDIKMLFLTVGMTVLIKKSGKKQWCVEISGDNLSFVYKMCGKNKSARFDKLYAPKHRGNHYIHLYKNWSISRITKVVEIDYHGQIYGIETGQSSFTTAFAVYS